MSKRHVGSINQLERLTQQVAEHALPVIHYEIDDNDNFADPLIRLVRNIYRAGLCRTVQLNGNPSVEQVQKIKDEYPGMHFISQVRPEVLAGGEDGVIATMKQHNGALTYGLIDPSCGKGKDISLPQAVRVCNALQTHLPDVVPGFAGGFSGENVQSRVYALVKTLGHGMFSIDAEGKLRDDADELSVPFVREYVRETRRGLRASLS